VGWLIKRSHGLAIA